MKWYLAKIVFRIVCGNGNHTPQFDEQFRLLSAENAALAFIKAVNKGNESEERFYNIHKQVVQWKFLDVPEIILINEMVDGTEIYSSIKESDDAADYEWNIHARAEILKKKCEAMLESLGSPLVAE